MNHYELLAGSIRLNIIDENVCKSIVIDDVLFAYDSGQPIIQKLNKQEGGDDFFCELKWLAERWRKDPQPDESKNWFLESLREIRRV